MKTHDKGYAEYLGGPFDGECGPTHDSIPGAARNSLGQLIQLLTSGRYVLDPDRHGTYYWRWQRYTDEASNG